MIPIFFLVTTVVLSVLTQRSFAQVSDFRPVTREMLLSPHAGDWLMLNRTYDEQRFSPLNQIKKKNVGQLRMVWSRGMPAGSQESVPVVYRGVMYLVSPGGGVHALNATNGDMLWDYRRFFLKETPSTLSARPQEQGRKGSRSLKILSSMMPRMASW